MSTASRNPVAPAPPVHRAPPRKPGRRAPAGSADLVLRLLLRHSDWWNRLPGADHELLHGLAGAHGAAVAWLEQVLTEQHAPPWSVLAEALADQPWAGQARAWVDAAAADEEHSFEDLQRVLHRLWRELLEEEARTLVSGGALEADALQRYRLLQEQIRIHRLGERDPAAAQAASETAAPRYN